jgi:spermidine synthase
MPTFDDRIKGPVSGPLGSLRQRRAKACPNAFRFSGAGVAALQSPMTAETTPETPDEGHEPYSMLDWPVVERTRISDGTEFVLGRHGDGWVIRVGLRVLMSNRMHDSEEALAEIGLARVESPRAVLVGGLGLGYTLRAVLDRVSKEAEVTVLELVPELVDWNQRYLGVLAGHPLQDSRTRVIVGDVFDTLKKSPAAFDVILLDVDNGPQGLTQPKNQRIYGEFGVRACLAALKPGGVLAVWASGPNARFQRRLERLGAEVEVMSVSARAGSRMTHVVFLAKAPKIAATRATRTRRLQA